jgi:hypothetical protein
LVAATSFPGGDLELVLTAAGAKTAERGGRDNQNNLSSRSSRSSSWAAWIGGDCSHLEGTVRSGLSAAAAAGGSPVMGSGSLVTVQAMGAGMTGMTGMTGFTVGMTLATHTTGQGVMADEGEGRIGMTGGATDLATEVAGRGLLAAGQAGGAGRNRLLGQAAGVALLKKEEEEVAERTAEGNANSNRSVRRWVGQWLLGRRDSPPAAPSRTTLTVFLRFTVCSEGACGW